MRIWDWNSDVCSSDLTFLHCPFDGRSLWRKARFPFPLDQFFFFVKGLVADGVPAFIPAEIKVSIGLHRLPDRLACDVMRGLTCATEPIIAYVENVIHFLEIR